MTALEKAQRREAQVRELLPQIEGALRRQRLSEALTWITEALQALEGGELYALHVKALDSLIALACVAVEIARANGSLQDTAAERLRRGVALRAYSVTGKRAA